MTEDEITAKIQEWQAVQNSQPHEVAAKFACEARSHLRNGKIELALRKMRAAENVVSGGGRD